MSSSSSITLSGFSDLEFMSQGLQELLADPEAHTPEFLQWVESRRNGGAGQEEIPSLSAKLSSVSEFEFDSSDVEELVAGVEVDSADFVQWVANRARNISSDPFFTSGLGKNSGASQEATPPMSMASSEEMQRVVKKRPAPKVRVVDHVKVSKTTLKVSAIGSLVISGALALGTIPLISSGLFLLAGFALLLLLINHLAFLNLSTARKY